jgi:serine/threonine protein phosphatase 1
MMALTSQMFDLRYTILPVYPMSTYAIGDIQGNLDALDALVFEIEPELHTRDTVVFLADYIDRGPNSKGWIQRILQLKTEAPCRIISLLGNHEQWMLNSMDAELYE